MSRETSIQTLGQRRRLLEWSQRVAECRGSGLPVSRRCRENGVNVKTYYNWNWQKKVFEAMAEERREVTGFAEVRVQHSENSVAATVRVGPAAVCVRRSRRGERGGHREGADGMLNGLNCSCPCT